MQKVWNRKEVHSKGVKRMPMAVSRLEGWYKMAFPTEVYHLLVVL